MWCGAVPTGLLPGLKVERYRYKTATISARSQVSKSSTPHVLLLQPVPKYQKVALQSCCNFMGCKQLLSEGRDSMPVQPHPFVQEPRRESGCNRAKIGVLSQGWEGGMKAAK